MLTLGAGTSGGVERTIWQCVAHGPSTGAGARVGSVDSDTCSAQ